MVRQDWVIDVLADLKCFARSNGLPDLAEQLDDTIHIALVELTRLRPDAAGMTSRNETEAGDAHHWLATSDLSP